MKKNILILLLCLLISGLVSCFLGQGADWDFLAYHYYNGYAALTGRVGYDLMPAGIQSYLNPFLDIFHFLIIKYFHNFPTLVRFVFGFYWGILTYILYLLNVLLFSKIKRLNGLNNLIIFFAVTIGATECIIVSEIGMSFNDIPIAILVLSSLYFLLKTIYLKKDKSKIYLLCLSGLFVGSACGIKLTAFPYAIALAGTIGILGFGGNWKNYIKKIFLFSLSCLIGFLLLNGYWMYILDSNFGSPMFPLYNAFLKSELYTFLNYHDYRFINFGFSSICAYPLFWSDKPQHLVCDIEFFDFRHSVAYFAFVALFFKSLYMFFFNRSLLNKKNIMTTYIIVFVALSYIIWLKYFGILRYLSPVLALSGTLIMLFVSDFISFIKSKKLSIIFLICLFLFLNIKYISPQWGRVNKLPQITDFKFQDGSIVYMYGKPSSYLIVGQNPKARYVYIAGHIDDGVKGFMPSDKYMELIDKYSQAATKTYLIRRRGDIADEAKKYNTQMMINKYLNKKMKCADINSMYKYTKPNYGVADFEICEFL